jgi:hypothetical protein
MQSTHTQQAGDANTGWYVAGHFLATLSRRDFAAMRDCLAPDVHFRAMLPPRVVDVIGPDEVIPYFERWYGGDAEFEVSDATIGSIGAKHYIKWRIKLTDSMETRMVEQHAYVSTDTHIVAMDLLCSGFVTSVTADVSTPR